MRGGQPRLPGHGQSARLAAERAQYDAPIDPDHLPGQEEIEAEVRSRPMGRTVADICRDFGVVPGPCTRTFWDALMVAITRYDGSAAKCWEDMQRKSEVYQREQENDPASEQMERGASVYPHQTLEFKIGEPPIAVFRNEPGPAIPRHDVSDRKVRAAAQAESTDPPPREAKERAA